MATNVVGMPNGNYAHQGYAGMDQSSSAYTAYSSSPQPGSQSTAPSTAASAPPTNQQQSDISKDEVGWYFVEQYYTTLSRSPEKLYLFYNKRSQFVSGQETDKVPVCVGQRAINDKIRDLDFQDCKVRVTNVDSQSSDSNIVIQVIGEISNKGQAHRKFTQTFVLATQTNGYFVLNDIFRYIVEEEEEPEQEVAHVPSEEVQQLPSTESGDQEPEATKTESKPLTSSADPTTIENGARELDKAIEEKLQPVQDEPAPVANGESTAEETKAEDEAPAASPLPDTVPAAEAERPGTTDVDIQPEKPKEPEPTPVASPRKQATPQPAPAQKPPVVATPMTWAGRAAAAASRVATPAAPAAASTASHPTATTPASNPAPAAAQKPSAPAATPAQSTPSAPTAPTGPAAQHQDTAETQDEWNTVGHHRQQSRQTTAPQPEQPQHRGYIKNVHETVNPGELRSMLEKFGELLYLDIARQKNCAFVDFKTAEGYNTALATPFKLGDDELYVEERRIRPGSTPYVPRGQFQGGRGNRGGAGGQRGGPSGPRGGARGAFQGSRGARGGGGAGAGAGGAGGAGNAAPA